LSFIKKLTARAGHKKRRKYEGCLGRSGAMDAENIKSGSFLLPVPGHHFLCPVPLREISGARGAFFHRKKGFNRHKKIMSDPDSIISVSLILNIIKTGQSEPVIGSDCRAGNTIL
jgi:hypothetical protein